MRITANGGIALASIYRAQTRAERKRALSNGRGAQRASRNDRVESVIRTCLLRITAGALKQRASISISIGRCTAARTPHRTSPFSLRPLCPRAYTPRGAARRRICAHAYLSQTRTRLATTPAHLPRSTRISVRASARACVSAAPSSLHAGDIGRVRIRWADRR